MTVGYFSDVWGDSPALVSRSAKPLALVETRGRPRFVVASQAFTDALRAAPTAIMGRTIDEVLGAKNGPALLATCRSCLTTAETIPLRVAIAGSAGPGLITFAVHPTDPSDGHRVIFKITDVRQGAPASSQPNLLGDGHGLSFTYINDLGSGQVRYADEGLASVLGFPAEGVLPFHEVGARIHPDDQARYDAYLAARHGVSDGAFIGAAIRLRDMEGGWRLISLRARVLRRDHAGRVQAMLGSATDITEGAEEALGVSLHRAEENERARVGRELHDSTSQYLVGAELGVSSVLRTCGLSEKTREQLHRVQASLASAHQEMRALAFLLHPPQLRELGLSKSIDRFCAGFAGRTDLSIDFICRGLPRGLSPDAAHALFRVCQEALMNVHHHASARRVDVRLGMKRRRLVLEIRDDGIGVEGLAHLEHEVGVGVASMRSRMAEIGGELEFDFRGPGFAVVARTSRNGDVPTAPRHPPTITLPPRTVSRRLGRLRLGHPAQ